MDPPSPGGFGVASQPQTQPAPAPQPNGPTFGMQAPATPNAELTGMLDNLFGAPK